MIINTPQGNIEITPSDESYRYKRLMGENFVEITTTRPDYVEIPVGSQITIDGEAYTLLQPQQVKKIHNRYFEIILRFEGSQETLNKFMYRDTIGSLKFSLTAKLSEHMELLVMNLNERNPGWSFTIIETGLDTEKTITAAHNTIAEILESIREAYKTEYEITGKSIKIGKVEYYKADPLPLSYGKGNGFKSGVKRENYSNEKQIDVLFVQGTERNINPQVYGRRYLMLPPGAIFEHLGKSFEVDEFGFSIYIEGQNTAGATEGSLDLSEIYPRREGVVSTVTTENLAKNFYNFTDNTIPEELDYSQCFIKGEDPLIAFQTGALAGKEFKLSQYVHSSRTFKVVPQEIDGVTMPDAGSFRIQAGDKYIILNINMPQAYIQNDADQTGASWEMAKEAAKYLIEHQTPRFSFVGELDSIWASEVIDDVPRWAIISPKIKVGSYILFSDQSIETEGVTIRITGIKDYLYKPSAPEIELSNISGAKSIAGALNKLETETVVTKKLYDQSIAYAKRGFREAKETSEALQSALLNFGNGINPVTISTMQLLVGDPSLQFYFVDNTTNPQRIQHVVVYNKTTKELTAPAGIIQHKTIGIDDIRPNRPANQYRYWSLNTLIVDVSVLDTTKYYYLYAQCDKATSSGQFIISATGKALDDGANYNLLVGVLNSESEGDRSFVSLYGFTEILPGRITIDKLISESGDQFIDLQTGEIRGNFTFTNGQNVGTQLDAAIQNALAALQAAQDAQDFIDNTLPGITDDINDQLDRKIESWFQSSDPAIAWTTNEVRSAHTGDMWYNTTTKLLKRYTLDGSVYSWSLIEDQKAIDAYTTASLAKDTADGKRRVFVSQPQNSDAYDIGDLWVNATSAQYKDDLLRCVVAKTAGQIFSINHWSLASKYTDDTAAVVAQNLAKFGAGKMLFRDPTFSVGMNSTTLYNNMGGTAVLLQRIAKEPDNPTTSTHQLKITYAGGSNGADPGLGGFRFNTPMSRAGGIFIIRLVAKIPVGYSLETTYNAIGTGGNHTWLSSRSGTGTYQDYIVMIRCGVSGSFSNFGYIYLEGPTTPNIQWHIAYGTILDALDPEMQSTQYLLQALQSTTDINGGLFATVVMMLKNAVGEVTGGMSGLSADNIGMWTGGTYTQAINSLAKVILRKDGSGQLAGGKILWDLAGALNVGNFKIEGGAIIGYSANKQKIKFHTGNIDVLSSLSGLVTTDPIRYSVNVDEEFINSTAAPFDYNLIAKATGEITVPANTQITLYFPNVSITPGSAGSVASSSKFYRIKLGETLIGEYTPTTSTVVLTAGGTYKIDFVADFHITVEASATTSISVTTSTEGYLTYQVGVERFEIGQNGFYVFYSTTAYIYFRSDYGFEGRWGNIGLRFITGQSNPQKMVGGAWSDL